MGVFRGNTRGVLLLAGVLTMAALLAPAGAAAAAVVNGGFETGSLKGWRVFRATEAGDWFAYKGTEAPIGGRRGAEPIQAPPVGNYAAIADQANPETGVLYQDVALEPGRAHRLDLVAYYNSYEPLAIPTPETLSVDKEVLAGQSNQQFRIDVMSPAAPIDSIAAGDILGTVFRTEVGGPQEMQPTGYSLNLSAFAGQTVRLRIANAVSEEVFNAGVDGVEVVSGPPRPAAAAEIHRLQKRPWREQSRRAEGVQPRQGQGEQGQRLGDPVRPGLGSRAGLGEGRRRQGDRQRRQGQASEDDSAGVGPGWRRGDREAQPAPDRGGTRDPQPAPPPPRHRGGDLQAGRRSGGNGERAGGAQARGPSPPALTLRPDAAERSRTFTGSRPHGPEPCASTSSATAAGAANLPVAPPQTRPCPTTQGESAVR